MCCRATGGSKRRIWRKIHIGIDEETLEVRAVDVTGSNISDAPVLPDLLNQIPSSQDIGSVTADGAYDTRKCHEEIAAINAHAVKHQVDQRLTGQQERPFADIDRTCRRRSAAAPEQTFVHYAAFSMVGHDLLP